jgi:hypothetical protein
MACFRSLRQIGAAAVACAVLAAAAVGCGSSSTDSTSSAPTRPAALGFESLREAVLRGAARDWASGTQIGGPEFEACLQLRLKPALDRDELASPVQVYRREGGQQFVAQALNTLAAPLATRCGGRGYAPEMIEASRALRFGRLRGGALDRLGVSYGPYLGVRCRVANSPLCDRVGIDIVFKRKVSAVLASIGCRAIDLRTPGMHDGIRGKDWVGTFENAGMSRKGSPLYIRPNGRAAGRWAGNPPVYAPIQVSVTYADGHRVNATFPHVFLSPGWG